MKYENPKIGLLVLDQYGNEYEVLRLNDLPYYATLKCTKFVKRVEVRHDEYITNICQVINAINTEYFGEKYGLKTDKSKYITIESLITKSDSVLNEKYIENCFDDILDKVDTLEQYNSNENAFYARQSLTNFKKDLLEIVKNLEKSQ